MEFVASSYTDEVQSVNSIALPRSAGYFILTDALRKDYVFKVENNKFKQLDAPNKSDDRPDYWQVAISFANYISKDWTQYELKAMQSRALLSRIEYIPPVKIDETEIPGLPPQIAICLYVMKA